MFGNIAKLLSERGHDVVLNPLSTEIYDYHIGHGDAFFFSNGRSRLPEERYNTLIGHSHDLDWGPTERCKKVGLWLLPSKLKYDEYVKYMGEDNCRLVGWPKADILYKQEKREVMLKTREELDMPYENTVLYAPSSWCFLTEGIATHPSNVDSLLEQFRDEKLNLIIKEHIHWKQGNWDVRNKAMEKAKGMRNVRWLSPDYSLWPLILVSDTLLTWRFCCVFKEFMLKGPVIELLDGPKRRDKEMLKGPYPDTDIWKVPLYYKGLNGYSDSIMPTIEQALEKPDEYADIRKRMIERYFYKPDGHATERAVEAIEEMIECQHG